MVLCLMNTTTETEDARLVKVGFRDAAGDVETLWAFDLGDGRYRLDSTPWFQYGVSYQDVVEASPEADGMLFFSRVVAKSGNCTVRVHADDGVSSELIERLVAIGCTYEGASPKYIAFDVPVASDSMPLLRCLLKRTRIGNTPIPRMSSYSLMEHNERIEGTSRLRRSSYHAGR